MRELYVAVRKREQEARKPDLAKPVLLPTSRVPAVLPRGVACWSCIVVNAARRLLQKAL